MTISQVNHIAQDLRDLGVREGGVLLVHSSLRVLGYVEGGPETVIQALLAALGPEGTLLMPALSYEHVTRCSPIFDVRYTPSNVGAIPEYFRLRPGTRRSVHPTHSVCAVGPRTGEMLDDHPLDDTPCGPHSPFHKLRDVGGQLLMLGCGLHPNTSFHAMEELIVPPYLFGDPLTYTLIDADGRSQQKTYRTHAFIGYEQRYDRLADVLDEPALHRGRVLAAEVYLIDVPAMWDAALAALRRDALYFVEVVA
ncbi:MAG: AAC(3) family N-acetyltransferase [Anaerolineae bacterium]